MKSEIKDIDRPNIITIWITASRPHTLTASICPCIVSYVANYKEPQFYSADIILWILFCITVQLGTNLHNDYSDYIKGADTKETRIGHIRATAAGWLTPYETCVGATVCLSITLLCGISLILSIQNQFTTNLFLWFIILSSIFNAFAYTAGPYPLGYIGLQNYSIAYYGLGDIFVFLYFGLVATYMIPYIIYLRNSNSSDSNNDVNTRQQPMQQLLLLPSNYISQIIYGIQIGLLAMNILVVNNLRDRLTDVLVNKLTTSVRFGRTFSIIQYITCNALTYTLVIVNTIQQQLLHSNNNYNINSSLSIVSILLSLLPLVSIPFAILETVSVIKKEGAALNIHVGGAAKVQTLFCILTVVSIYLSDYYIA